MNTNTDTNTNMNADTNVNAATTTNANANANTDATAIAAANAGATATANVSFPCGRNGIEALLPHRDPFIWLSRILECTPGERIVAELDVSPSLELFQGHFPTYPVLPGVILMEALAQTASCCLLAQENLAGSVGFLTGIDKAKFRRQVHPGDIVRLEAHITRNNKRMCAADVAAYVEGELCASASQKYVIARETTED